jgi:hypothetical protein
MGSSINQVSAALGDAAISDAARRDATPGDDPRLANLGEQTPYVLSADPQTTASHL